MPNFLPRLALLISALPTTPGPPARFVVPRTAAEWEVRRPDLRRSIRDAFGGDRFFSSDIGFGASRPEPWEGVEITRISLGATRRSSSPIPDRPRQVEGVIVRPVHTSGRLPGVVFLGDGPDPGFRPGLDGKLPAVELARRGVISVSFDVSGDAPWGERDAWPSILNIDTNALTILRRIELVDPDRFGVVGIGLGATRAAWLMAMDDSIKFGVAIGGMTRLADWYAAHPDAKVPSWAASLLDGKDLEAVTALCAGRYLEWTIGDRDPSTTGEAIGIVEGTVGRMGKIVASNPGFHVTRLGRQDGRYGRLPWMGAMEIVDKLCQPQRATPLDHPPDPEPERSAGFIDLTADGIAGWVPEMSQRPGTWTWADGVVSCKPGPNEYGWLRAPIQLGNFILTLEWRVPPGGNMGLFLRAKPVPWSFPPGQASKRVVSALGLDWPSRTGLELQMTDDHGHADRYSSGSLYRHAAPASNPTLPAGEWNRYTVRCQRSRVEVWVNGTEVLDSIIDGYPLTLPDPPRWGYVGLQNHGSPGEYRAVRLRVLP